MVFMGPFQLEILYDSMVYFISTWDNFHEKTVKNTDVLHLEFKSICGFIKSNLFPKFGLFSLALNKHYFKLHQG